MNIDNEVLRDENKKEKDKDKEYLIYYDIVDESDDEEFIKNLLLEQKRNNKI